MTSLISAITVASLALGWVGEPAVSHLIEPVLAGLNVASDRVVTMPALSGIPASSSPPSSSWTRTACP